MTIEERLESMEKELGRQKRRSRWLLGAILLLAGGLIVPGMFEATTVRARAQAGGTAKEIRAKAFFLEDNSGVIRAELSVGEFGPGLWMYDENGGARAWLGMDKDGPALALLDEKRKPRAKLATLKDGSALALLDENGELRTWIHVGKDGPSLALWDENGKNRASLAIIKEGSALTLYDENEKDRTMLSALKNGQGLVLWDEKHQPRFVAGKTTTITPEGKTIEYPESSLILFGPDGNVIWSAIK